MEQHYNRVRLCGCLLTAPELSHINHDRQFDRCLLSVPRLSGQTDEIWLLLPHELPGAAELSAGDTVSVSGQLRSYNNRSGVGSRLVLSVFVRSLAKEAAEPVNRIRLSGVICKPPHLRRTPLGREICDVILAVNRRCGRADYLPCIAWGAVAQTVGACAVGDVLTAEGRIQSRRYTKLTDGQPQQRTAYEVSIMRPAKLEEFWEESV